MRGRDFGEHRDDVATFHGNRSSDLTFGHHGHASLQFRRVSEFQNLLPRLHQTRFFHLYSKFLRYSIQVLIADQFNGNLLRHIADLLFGFPGRYYRPDGFLQFFKWTVSRFLFLPNFDDMDAELRLDEIADSSRSETERHLLKFRDHLTPSEGAEIASICCRSVFGELLCKTFEVFAFLCALKHVARLLADRCDFLRLLFLGLEENVLRRHAVRKPIFGLVLLVILPQLTIAYRHLGAHLDGFHEDVPGLTLLWHTVLRLVLLVIIALVLVGEGNLVVEFRGINDEVVEFCLFIAAFVFGFDLFVAHSYARRDETFEFVCHDVIPNTGLKLLDREIILGENGLIASPPDEVAGLAKCRVFKDSLFNIGDRRVETKTPGLLGHHMAHDEGIHDLVFKSECTKHFRSELTPHSVDVIAISGLKFPCTNAIVPY